MKQPAKTPRRIEAPDMSIDWEDLPSLAYLLVEAESMFGNQPVWLETLPSGFDDLAPSDPFREPLPGMAIREVNEPEIFKLFFGQRSQ